MTQNEKDLTRALSRIFATDADSISCDIAGEIMARAIDVGLDLQTATQQYPSLQAHLDVCIDCGAEFEMMQALSEMKEEEIAVKRIPPRPRSPKMSWPQVSASIQAIFSGFMPLTNAMPTRSSRPSFAPVTVTLDDSLSVELEMAQTADDPAYCDLFVHFDSEDDDLMTRFEGSTCWLQSGDEGPALQEATVGEFGDVVFDHLTIGQPYALRVHIANREFTVTQIVLPK